MPSETRWLINDKVIFQRMWGDITVEDIEHMSAESKQLIDVSDRHLVHIITDNTGVTSSPPPNLTRKASQDVMQHPRFGWFIVYGKNERLERFFFQLATSIFNVRSRWFNTYEDSLDFLKKVDTALTDDLEQARSYANRG